MKPYYDDGKGIVIYHGDCREILGLMSADFVVSDPPYGMAYRHGARKGGLRLGADEQSIVGDFAPFDPAPILEIAAERLSQEVLAL